ncbi:MAG: hypothetical protein ACREAB_19345 [Blastocatellia bacterium]
MAREFDAASAEQNVGALAIERLARGVAVQRFRPGRMRVLMASGAARRREELLDGNQLAVFGCGVRRSERTRRNGWRIGTAGGAEFRSWS